MKLNLGGITDLVVRDNFQKIRDFFRSRVFLSSEFRHYEISVSQTVTNQTYPHGLSFIPKDVIETWVGKLNSNTVSVGTVTWNYDLFDNKNVNFSTTGPCIIRAFIGSYREDTDA